MEYVGDIYRPPSEAGSVLVQVTVGCSHNRCTYCAMYRDKRFRVKPWKTVAADIAEAAALGPVSDTLFLCDGDALILPTERLLQILAAVRSQLPWIRRVGAYGDTRSVLLKNEDELRALAEAGLGIVYHGMESGDDEVLRQIDKGGTAAQAIETARRLRAAGITHSVIVMLGIGGVERSRAHAEATAAVLTQMDPPFAAALTTTIVPGTPLSEAEASGRFRLPGKFELLAELRAIVAGAHFTHCRFSCNHASNYLPLRGDMPADADRLLGQIDAIIASGDERLLKPEFLRGL
jgi:radical SAM superfamily enzyme YgiQ (UPF0313 family)